jgi:L-ascorbate metabolism protein UlaG (beta-lactamase superfamily)
MEIQYFGGNCVKINSKKASVVVDDNLKELGGGEVTKAGDIVLYTGTEGVPNQSAKFVVARPGDYEISDVAISGVAARAHRDEADQRSATMYRIVADDVRVAVVGHIHPDITEAELEALGVIDVLVIPVGGHGFTLDPVGALKVIKEIEPKIIIPTNYADSKLKYPVPALSLEEALKELAMEPKETVPKLKIKGTADLLNDQAQLIILERQ